MSRDSANGLPMIKCSSCGVDIDILQLADHVCAPSAPLATAAPAVTPPASPKLDRVGSLGSFSQRSDGPAPTGRTRPPPRIDPNAANKPFRPFEPSPMTSHSDPRGRSPMRSRSPPKSPFKMNRSVTTPVPRPRLAPPSPTLPSNLDCAFPPFPSKKSATPQSPRPPPRQRLEPTPQQSYAEPNPLFAPLSPRFDGGDNIKKRLDSIAPGPFDGRADRRPSTSASSKPPSPLPEITSFGHRRTATQGSARSVGSTSRQRTSVSSTMSRASTYSNKSIGLPAHPKLGANTNNMPPPPRPSAAEPSDGIDAFLDRLQKESAAPIQAPEMKLDSRREGSRERKEPPPRPRRPSETHLPSLGGTGIQYTAYTPAPINTFPVRKESVGAPDKSLMNPLYTPSDSGLSDDSYASSGFRSVASSRSSPPGSVAGHSRQASKLGRSEYLGDAFERTTSPDSYVGSPKHSAVNASEPVQPLSPAYAEVPESPMDPAIQLGIASDRRPKGMALRQDSGSTVAQSPLRLAPDVAPNRQNSRQASKGKCRGCSEPIVGKSVKDSSGRLTGRYHKHCFVCKTCSDPFPTAEFYVYENSPYCERHYHELNGSICVSCNHGIEGQYLETDARTKFHPRCFTCTTCRVVLRDGYYEFNGQRYCDRHAQSAAAPPQNYLGPSGYRPRMEKRSTRLMMMA